MTPCSDVPPIVDTVFGVVRPERRRHLLIALLATIAVHALLALAMRQVGQRRGSVPVEPQRRLEVELARVEVVEPAKPALTPLQEHPNPPRMRHKPVGVDRRRVTIPQPPAPAPAPAAPVVARESDPGAPVDMTEEVIVTGHARAYAGGVTAARGTNHSDVAARDLGSGRTPVAGAAAFDHSQPVSLESENWSCAWPVEAELDWVGEQTVVIRVLVDAAGNTESATILVDPGQGFGPAATRCAMRTRFTPARDREGRPVRATSPPIRITFTR